MGPLGIKVVSMDFLLSGDETPVIWRGPLKMKAIQQFLSDITWGDLEFLFIDLPPGTGDEPLSVMQLIPDMDGVIIVTIPSEVSQVVMKKAVTFARQLSTPIIGIIENMSGYIIGGDTNEASNLVISISLFGIAKKTEVVLRSGAKHGDIVAVTGFFGKTAAGLKILVDGFEAPAKIRRALVESVLMPKARLKEGLALSQIKAVTASIDSSDGLAWSLHEIARASKVGFLINKLPIADEAEKFAETHNLDPLELALYGGEEKVMPSSVLGNLSSLTICPVSSIMAN